MLSFKLDMIHSDPVTTMVTMSTPLVSLFVNRGGKFPTGRH
jgi:hypothetical protein